MTGITEQLASLQSRVRHACVAANRSEHCVTILAVSKKKPVASIRAAQQAGLEHFGENYVQEALTKIPEIDPPAVWHFIGPLQANKTRAVAEHFDWIQSLSSERIARRLSAQRPQGMAPLQVCLQVSPRGADARAGLGHDELEPMARFVSESPGLQLRGLMIIPLAGLGERETRAEFARVRQYADELRALGFDIDTLSMGMSGDFEWAILEGSTMIRIGTKLFGARE